MPVSAPDVLALVVCPACYGVLAAKEGTLVCDACNRRYPLRDGIPVLIVDQAISFDGTPH